MKRLQSVLFGNIGSGESFFRFVLVALVSALPFWALAVAPSAAESLKPTDFAVGRDLVGSPGPGLRAVWLDYDVYRRSVEAGLADLRVFDGQGEALPYALERPRVRPAEARRVRLQEVPKFSLSTASGKLDRDLLGIEVTNSGAIVRIDRAGGGAVASATVSSWLIDASGIEESIGGLEFAFAPDEKDFVVELEVEASEDLARWRKVGERAVIARLMQGGQSIERRKIDLPHFRATYVRVRAVGAAPLPAIDATRLELHAPTDRESRAPFRSTERIAGAPDSTAVDTVLFDLGGAPRIEAVRVELTEPGALAEGTLESASSLEGPWRPRGREVFFAYERDGVVVRNEFQTWRAGGDRYLRLVISEKGGGLRGAVPRLAVRWQPDRLLFLSRGTGTAELVVGRRDTPDASFGADALRLTEGKKGAERDRTRVELGPERVLAGDAATRAPVGPEPRVLALWALLIVSVGAVLGLAIRVLRSPDPAKDD